MRTSIEIKNALQAIGSVNESTAQLFDELVQEAALDRSEYTLEALLESLDDQCPFDELMFSVVHAIESRDRSRFLNCLLKSLDATRERAPRWSRILHTRIMNSPEVFKSYLDLLPHAHENSKAALTSILNEIYLKPNFSLRARVGLAEIESGYKRL